MQTGKQGVDRHAGKQRGLIRNVYHQRKIRESNVTLSEINSFGTES